MVVPPRIRRGLSQEVRSQSKKIITRAMGGKCCICGYNKCIQALEFHHVNPHEKDFHFNKMKIFLNEELWRISSKLKESRTNELIKESVEIDQKIQKIQDNIKNLKIETIDEELIKKVMLLQELVSEVTA